VCLSCGLLGVQKWDDRGSPPALSGGIAFLGIVFKACILPLPGADQCADRVVRYPLESLETWRAPAAFVVAFCLSTGTCCLVSALANSLPEVGVIGRRRPGSGLRSGS